MTYMLNYLVNNIKPAIASQNFRNYDAFRGLVIL